MFIQLLRECFKRRQKEIKHKRIAYISIRLITKQDGYHEISRMIPMMEHSLVTFPVGTESSEITIFCESVTNEMIIED